MGSLNRCRGYIDNIATTIQFYDYSMFVMGYSNLVKMESHKLL